jgi:NADH-quinone oxidoreductase subunit K
MTRRNGIAVLMGVELILNAANINFVAFSRFGGMNLDGHIFSLFVIVLAAAEAAVALAIVINIYNNLNTINIDNASELKN